MTTKTYGHLLTQHPTLYMNEQQNAYSGKIKLNYLTPPPNASTIVATQKPKPFI